MQVTIEIPDGLPPEQLRQRIQTIQAMLQENPASAPASSIKPPAKSASADPWSNPEVPLPAVDAGIEDLAHQHDHHLYGTPRR